jgi:hypothetical protein
VSTDWLRLSEETLILDQMTMAIHDPPNPNERQHLHLSLLPDFHLNVKVTSLVGSRAKLQGQCSAEIAALA